MLSEGIHERLADVYNEFDKHSYITNTDYSIDADYYDMQGYTILKCHDFDGFIRHIANYIKNKPVDMLINNTSVEYDNLNDRNFRIPKRRNNLITFTITPLQEEEMEDKMEDKKDKNPSTAEPVGEDQYKFSSNKVARKQNPRNRSKYRKTGKTAFSVESFEKRFKNAVSEEVEFVNPEILFTKSFHTMPEIEEVEEDPNEILEENKKILSNMLERYLTKLENTNNEKTIVVLEQLIEECIIKINKINEMKGSING